MFVPVLIIEMNLNSDSHIIELIYCQLFIVFQRKAEGFTFVWIEFGASSII